MDRPIRATFLPAAVPGPGKHDPELGKLQLLYLRLGQHRQSKITAPDSYNGTWTGQSCNTWLAPGNAGQWNQFPSPKVYLCPSDPSGISPSGMSINADVAVTNYAINFQVSEECVLSKGSRQLRRRRGLHGPDLRRYGYCYGADVPNTAGSAWNGGRNQAGTAATPPFTGFSAAATNWYTCSVWNTTTVGTQNSAGDLAIELPRLFRVLHANEYRELVLGSKSRGLLVDAIFDHSGRE